MNIEKMDNEKLELNLRARHKRYARVFLKSGLISGIFGHIAFFLKNSLRRKRRKTHLTDPIIIKDPFSKFVRQSIAVGVALLVVTSIAPTRILETGFTADAFTDDSEFIEIDEEFETPPFFLDENGFVLKTSPVSEDANRIGFTDSVQHTVQAGDTLSGIAALYGISVKTLVWENNLSEDATLKVGQVLNIPAVDGVSVTVSSDKETLASIAKSYGVEVALIKEHNNLEGDVIRKGQKLFIPGGKKKEPIIVRSGARGEGRSVARNTFDTKIVMGSDAQPGEGKKLIYPTTGKQTQGFRGGHYGLDISNPAKPDIWAAAAGTVVTAAGGCLPREVRRDRRCGGGYGNYVIIDHGDGLQTLYGHLETVYVLEGQHIEAGQAVGKMGNTGRVYGATGIHLHFEVYDNGAKRNPWNYM
ncbi:M23 family metallopeptidase [Candidatus Peregrinibacteria bacterium]|nr:M23 family metallopeptidase [Candidatus Peregrinibacteria bacterium]